MPAIPCNCGCGCYNSVGYYGLNQKFERDEFPLVCENCEEGFHYQDQLDALHQDNEDNTQTISKSEYDDDALTILKMRLAMGKITVDEYDRIKERLE